jgi:oligoendopeptidase F
MDQRPAFDPADLPIWNLGDLYSGVDAPEVARDLDAGEARAAAFEARYKDKLASLDGAGLAAAIREYEALEDKLGRLASFAQLTHAGNVIDPKIAKFYQTVQERLTTISTKTLFFTLELNRIEDRWFTSRMGDGEVARYAPWLREVRAFRPHQLSEELEKILHEKQVTGRAAWTRLFDETLAALEVKIGSETLSLELALHRLSDKDAAVREAAALGLGQALKKELRLLSLVTNTLAKDKSIEDDWRSFPRPVSSRNLANRVEDEVVDALVAAVRTSVPSLAHRYYRLKARWFGVSQLAYWDRNAPLPESDDRLIAWPEARDKVLDAYTRFSPRLGELGRQFFERPWIDAQIRPGKSPGAFAHPTVPSAHPFLLLNYQGRTRDVMTLAHELGHGVHQLLAAQQGALMADTPLTLAETASVFGEMLTFRSLLAATQDKALRKALLASKVEDMLNTVVRQIAFHGYEEKVHAERRQGEIEPERLAELWLAVQRESLGPAIRIEGDYRYWWGYIPHFIHSPFYVYAYAFGDCLVNSLFAVYEQQPDGFVEKYFAMLAAGGTLRHRELLAPFGLNAAEPAFWSRGLGLIGRLIDELEGLD